MSKPLVREPKPNKGSPSSLLPTWLDLPVLTVFAFAVRLIWTKFFSWVAGDTAWYLMVAKNIALKHFFAVNTEAGILIPTAYRPPLYPFFIAMLWHGESAPVIATLVVQCCLGAATVSIVYLLARDRFNRSVAFLAAAGMAIAPMTCRFTAVILSETLFTFLLTLGLLFWGKNRYAISGLVLGLATLVRVTLWPLLVLLPLLTIAPCWRVQRRAYITIMIVSLGIASVWVVRNALVFHRFIPVASGGYGTNLLLGTLNTKDADDVSNRKEFLRQVDQADATTTADESSREGVRFRAATARIRSNTIQWLMARLQQYPRLFIDSGSYLFGNGSTALRTAFQRGLITQLIVRIAIIGGNLLVFLFALFGILSERTRIVSLTHLLAFPIFLCVVSLPLWIEPRYSLPMMPLVAILASAGLHRFVKLLRATQ